MKNKNIFGFTLVELLVVMAIIGVLVGIVGMNFRSAQIRGRDTQRKSDLKQISAALELFYSDYGKYPDSVDGNIMACPYIIGGVSEACSFDGDSEFCDKDNIDSSCRTIYLKKVPSDPSSSLSYYYRVVPGSLNKKFQLYARLENSQDPNCVDSNDCTVSAGYVCGTYDCNFSITSANTTYNEQDE